MTMLVVMLNRVFGKAVARPSQHSYFREEQAHDKNNVQTPENHFQAQSDSVHGMYEMRLCLAGANARQFQVQLC